MTRWTFEGNPREQAAYGLIRAVFGLGESDLLPTGKGALSDKVIEDPLESPPDFFAPKPGLWFEVTGSAYTVEESASACLARFGLEGPHIFVRKGKADAFERQGIADRVIFVHIAEREGDVRFVPLRYLLRRAWEVDGFERCGKDRYYALPWMSGKKPHQLYEAEAVRMRRCW
ncbi:MAG: nuclease [Anaerolineae bacterium]